MEYTVYLRTNLINGKQYVGQSGNIKERNLTWKSYKTPYSRYILPSIAFFLPWRGF